MEGRNVVALLATVLAVVVAASGCYGERWQAELATPNEFRQLQREAPFLKVHMRSGELWVLERWTIWEDEAEVRGQGIRYSRTREEIDERDVTIPFGEIALLETNTPRQFIRRGPVIVGVSIGAGVGLIGAILVACSESKACFGSCPTFYADAGDGEGARLQAEGFSASVAPALEATDLDAIDVQEVDGRATVVMRNEALETHLVRHVRLVAVPRADDARILRAADAFHPVSEPRAPTACRVRERSCIEEVAAADGRELRTETDPDDLATKESIDLRFEPRTGRKGLIITARNSFVSTFVFYQVLAWMGRSATEMMLALGDASQSGGPSADAAIDALAALAEMEVHVRGEGGEWARVGTFDEVGPLARDRWLVVLPDDLPEGPLDVRVTMARGYFRVDEIALVDVGSPVPATSLEPVSVLRDGEPDPDALARLRDPAQQLVTYPGDEYGLVFELPPGEHELFLESRGYYFEWMREEWLGEENPAALATFLLDPARTFRELAPRFKTVEADADRMFWESRFRRGAP